jgi:LPS-assembly protein
MRSASHTPLILAPIGHAVRSLVNLIALGFMTGAPLHAQTLPTNLATDDARPTLKITQQLLEKPPEGPGNEVPTFVFGEKITGRTNLDTTIEGSAELRRGKTSLRADRLEYFQPDDLVKTRGNVRISNAGNLFWGPALEMKIDTFEGTFTAPSYRFLSGGNGKAAEIIFVGEKNFIANQATYTTCERDNESSWMPAWQMYGERFAFDFDREVGVATGTTLRFKNVPILHWPGSVSFPLSDKRKSGVMPPTFAVDTVSGVAVTVPYYFDIAPNRDATLTPTYATNRGLNLAGEFRYLEPTYRGILHTSYLPGDLLRNQDRWSLGYQHNGVFNTGVPRIGNIGVALTVNRVSDDNYWRDFVGFGGTGLVGSGLDGSGLGGVGVGGTGLTQRLLNNDLNLTWGQGFLTTGFRVQKWQTLQDIASPIASPYDRLPQITARYGRSNVPLGGINGVDWSVEGDFTGFSAVSTLAYPKYNGQRAFTRAQISRPFLWPAGYITPKLQLHATSYQFDAPLFTNGPTSANRLVPTFSLDAGLQFERDASFLGRSLLQTLEPRAFYVRTPYRNQSFLPIYDSGASGFNFATVFTENAFVGNDRISDENLLTLGVTSRLLDQSTGAELVRFGVAQRLRFEDQLVSLAQTPSPPTTPAVTDRLSDLLLGASVNWTPKWSVDAATQYNPKLGQSERNTLGARYSPSNYRVISASFRRQRELSEQFDIGWQWPINDLWGDKGEDLGAGRGQGGGRWYSVGRLNYSMLDKKLVDSVVGFEYDGCCWIGRVVLQRSQSSITTANTKIMFQLEFVGFSRIGNNPLATLRANIPKYQFLRDQVTPPSRFTNYD